MGAVFYAIDEQAPTHSQDVAIKVAKLKGGAQGDPDRAKAGFEREIRAAIMLSEYKNYFVGYRTSDQVDPAYIAFEYVAWPTLRKYVDESGIATPKRPHSRRRLPPLHVARIGVEVLRGIRCMERRRIVHRDLKPENIFVRRRDSAELFDAKIADLGVWSDAGEPGTIVDTPEAFKMAGTIVYMSPEQMRGEHLTTASDLHMLASVLWELATGSVPYPATSVQRAFTERVNALRKVPPCPPDMDAALYDVLAVALQHEPRDRTFADRTDKKQGAESFLSRGMEKALQRFADDHLERRRRTVDEATKRVDDAAEQLDDKCSQLTALLKLRDDALALQERIIGVRKDTLSPEDQIERYNALSDEADEFIRRIEEAATDGKSNPERRRPTTDTVRPISPWRSASQSSHGSTPARARKFTLSAVALSVIAGFTAAYFLFGRRDRSDVMTSSTSSSSLTAGSTSAVAQTNSSNTVTTTTQSAAVTTTSVDQESTISADAGVPDAEVPSTDGGPERPEADAGSPKLIGRIPTEPPGLYDEQAPRPTVGTATAPKPKPPRDDDDIY